MECRIATDAESGHAPAYVSTSLISSGNVSVSFSSWFFIRVISDWINNGVFFVWMASVIAFSLVDA